MDRRLDMTPVYRCFLLTLLQLLWFGVASAVPECPTDFLVIIDNSGSVRSVFEEEKSIASQLVLALDVSVQSTRVALVQFNEAAHSVFSFNAFNQKSDVVDAIQALSAVGGSTNTQSALAVAHQDFMEYARSNVNKIILLVTDGHSQNTIEGLQDATKSLINQGIVIFTATASDDPGILEFYIYTNNHPERIFLRGNITALVPQVTQTIASGKCIEDVPSAAPPTAAEANAPNSESNKIEIAGDVKKASVSFGTRAIRAEPTTAGQPANYQPSSGGPPAPPPAPEVVPGGYGPPPLITVYSLDTTVKVEAAVPSPATPASPPSLSPPTTTATTTTKATTTQPYETPPISTTRANSSPTTTPVPPTTASRAVITTTIAAVEDNPYVAPPAVVGTPATSTSQKTTLATTAAYIPPPATTTTQRPTTQAITTQAYVPPPTTSQAYVPPPTTTQRPTTQATTQAYVPPPTTTQAFVPPPTTTQRPTTQATTQAYVPPPTTTQAYVPPPSTTQRPTTQATTQAYVPPPTATQAYVPPLTTTQRPTTQATTQAYVPPPTTTQAYVPPPSTTQRPTTQATTQAYVPPPTTTQAYVPPPSTTQRPTTQATTQAYVPPPTTTQAYVPPPSTTQRPTTQATTQAYVPPPTTTQAFVPPPTTTQRPTTQATTQAYVPPPTTTQAYVPPPSTTQRPTTQATTQAYVPPPTATQAFVPPPTTTQRPTTQATTQAYVPPPTTTQAYVPPPSTTQRPTTQATTQAYVPPPTTTQAYVPPPSTTQRPTTQATTQAYVPPPATPATQPYIPPTTQPYVPNPPTTAAYIPTVVQPYVAAQVDLLTTPSTTASVRTIPVTSSAPRVSELTSSVTGSYVAPPLETSTTRKPSPPPATTPPVSENVDCKQLKADIIFLIDGSTSISTASYKNELLKFLHNFVSELDIGPQNSQVGIIQYTHELRTEFNLNKFQKKQELLDKIDHLEQLFGRTLTGKALEEMTTNGFAKANGARDGFPKIGIVITDGRAQDNVEVPAQRARNAGIKVVAIGITDHILEEELQEIAGSKDLVFLANNYSGLNTGKIHQLVTSVACNTEANYCPANNDCGQHSGCFPLSKSEYTCKCLEGYEDKSPDVAKRPGRNCVPRTHCDPISFGCSPNSRCLLSTPSGPRCSCLDGFKDLSPENGKPGLICERPTTSPSSGSAESIDEIVTKAPEPVATCGTTTCNSALGEVCVENKSGAKHCGCGSQQRRQSKTSSCESVDAYQYLILVVRRGETPLHWAPIYIEPSDPNRKNIFDLFHMGVQTAFVGTPVGPNYVDNEVVRILDPKDWDGTNDGLMFNFTVYVKHGSGQTREFVWDQLWSSIKGNSWAIGDTDLYVDPLFEQPWEPECKPACNAALGESCVKGTCTIVCKPACDGTKGLVCVKGVCAQKCVPGCDSAKGETCVSGVCQQTQCVPSCDASRKEVCTDGKCQCKANQRRIPPTGICKGTCSSSKDCDASLGEECSASGDCVCPAGKARRDPGSVCQEVDQIVIPIHVIRENENPLTFINKFNNANDTERQRLIELFIKGTNYVYGNSTLKPFYVSVDVNGITDPKAFNFTWTPGGVVFNATVSFDKGSIALSNFVYDEFYRVVSGTQYNIGGTGLILDQLPNGLPKCPEGQQRRVDNSKCVDATGFIIPLNIIRENQTPLTFTITLTQPNDEGKRLLEKFRQGITYVYGNSTLAKHFVTVNVTAISNPAEYPLLQPDAKGLVFNYTVFFEKEKVQNPDLVWSEMFRVVEKTKWEVGGSGLFMNPSQSTVFPCPGTDSLFCVTNATCGTVNGLPACVCKQDYANVTLAREKSLLQKLKVAGVRECMRITDINECDLGLDDCAQRLDNKTFCSDQPINFTCSAQSTLVGEITGCIKCNGNGDCIPDPSDATIITCRCHTWWIGENCQIDLRAIIAMILALLFLLLSLCCCLYFCLRCRRIKRNAMTAWADQYSGMGSQSPLAGKADYYADQSVSIPRAKLAKSNEMAGDRHMMGYLDGDERNAGDSEIVTDVPGGHQRRARRWSESSSVSSSAASSSGSDFYETTERRVTTDVSRMEYKSGGGAAATSSSSATAQFRVYPPMITSSGEAASSSTAAGFAAGSSEARSSHEASTSHSHSQERDRAVETFEERDGDLSAEDLGSDASSDIQQTETYDRKVLVQNSRRKIPDPRKAH